MKERSLKSFKEQITCSGAWTAPFPTLLTINEMWLNAAPFWTDPSEARYTREQHAKGNSANSAAQTFSLPQSLGDWNYFRAGFHEIAMDAWYRELNDH